MGALAGFPRHLKKRDCDSTNYWFGRKLVRWYRKTGDMGFLLGFAGKKGWFLSD